MNELPIKLNFDMHKSEDKNSASDYWKDCLKIIKRQCSIYNL